MSRIGKQVTAIPSGVDVIVADDTLTVKGPKATLARLLHKDVTVTVGADGVAVSPNDDDKRARALWGTFAAHVANMLRGVSEGFSKKLAIEGVGYRAEMNGRVLVLNVGFSHPVSLDVPEGLEAVVEKNLITISGADKELVGQFAANVRRVRPPEPYKGKGIRYQGEYVIRKQGKKAV